MKDEDLVREILREQARTAQAHALARAAAVRRHIEEKVPLMWALVAEETADTAEAAALADIEAKVLWYCHGVSEAELETP